MPHQAKLARKRRQRREQEVRGEPASQVKTIEDLPIQIEYQPQPDYCWPSIFGPPSSDSDDEDGYCGIMYWDHAKYPVYGKDVTTRSQGVEEMDDMERFIFGIVNWIVWSWTYLWALWFLLVVFVLYYLRGPLRISENIGMATMFLSTLTPKFYVALTGTSSLISGLILIFEWWYYRKYGTSFIEQVSLNHLGPLLGPPDYASNANGNGNGDVAGAITSGTQTPSGSGECKVWRNPLNLFRGAEYLRYFNTTNKEPLTFYDMNLSAQDHQTFFTCDSDSARPEYSLMQTAWRERNPQERIKGAKSAIEKNPDCATAYILLAEEEAPTIEDCEKLLKVALKAAETNLKKSQMSQLHGPITDSLHRRDVNVLIYIKRRLAMCARKLGRLKEAVKMFRDLTKEVQPIMSVLHVHENLIEALLEMQAYADVQAVLAKYDDGSVPRSAVLCYTSALLKVRQVSEKFVSESGLIKRGLSTGEMTAIEAIHRAVEYNPHVPKYLLELKPMVFPPEHLLKRGDSEAVAYAFFHLPHWKKVDGALQLLACTWEGTFASIPRPLEKGNLFFPYPPCTECPDREILPAHHEVSVFPERETPFFIMFTAGLCTFTALIAFLTHQYPDQMATIAKTGVGWFSLPIFYVLDKLEALLPSSLIQMLSRV